MLNDESVVPVPEHWLSDSIGRWLLRSDPALPVIRLDDEDGTSIGWMLGYPISNGGVLVSEKTLTLSREVTRAEPSIENFIYSFGGRFAVAIIAGQSPRFYLDPCGSLSAVFSGDKRIVASTPGLIPYDKGTPDRLRLARGIGIPETNAMYTLELTPRRGIDRLLPNHCLNLNTWQANRHWPRSLLSEPINVEEATGQIARVVKRNILAIAGRAKTRLALTAGKDSRMLLSCAKDLADSIECLTIRIGDSSSQIDCETASEIAREFALRHTLLSQATPTADDLDEWMYRISYSTGEIRGLSCATTMKTLAGHDYALLKGNVGEVARGFYWFDDDSENSVIPPERLAFHCHCPPHEEVLSRARRWLEMAPVSDSLQLLDLFYIEQRLGCWAGVWPYADCEAGFNIFPMCHRDVIERMLRLPTAYRRSGRLMQDIIAREWPELLRWPFNKGPNRGPLAGRLKQWADKSLMVLRHPSWALQRAMDEIVARPQWQRVRSSALRRS
jgi:hypothetical protein